MPGFPFFYHLIASGVEIVIEIDSDTDFDYRPFRP